MATEKIEIEVTEKGSSQVKRNLEDIGKGADKSSSSVSKLTSSISKMQQAVSKSLSPVMRLKSALGSVNSAFSSLNTSTLKSSLNSVNSGFNNMSDSLQKVKNSTSFLSNGTISRGVWSLKNSLASLIPTINGTTNSFYSLWRILLALAIIRQVSGFVASSIDTWTTLSNKLKQVSTDAANLVAVQEAIYKSSQLTRSSMEDTTLLYTRMAAATADLKMTQREVLDVVETVTMALKLNGGSTSETASALRQLSQAFNKGKLDGDEFRSIMENAPILQKAFADSLGVTKGELMDMSKKGKLTIPLLVKALKEAGPAIRESFGGSLVLISEGFVYLENAVVRFLGRLNEATGFSKLFYETLKFAADNIEAVAVAVTFLGTALLVTFGPRMVAALMSFGTALGFATGGLSLIVPLLAAAVAGVYAWGDSWKVTADGITVLDYIKVALYATWDVASKAAIGIGYMFSDAWSLIETTFGNIASFFGFAFSGVIEACLNTVRLMNALFSGSVEAIISAFSALPAALASIFKLAMNGAVQIVEDGINGINSAINSLLEAVSLPAIGLINLSDYKGEISEDAFDIGKKVKDGFNKGFEAGNKGFDEGLAMPSQILKTWTDKARIEKEAREAKDKLTSNPIEGATNSEVPDLSKLGGGGNGGYGSMLNPMSDALTSVNSELKKMHTLLAPLPQAQEKLRKSVETVNEAYSAGLITSEKRLELLQAITTKFGEQSKVLGIQTSNLNKNSTALGQNNEALTLSKEQLERLDALRKAGLTFGFAEIDQLQQKLDAMNALQEQAELLGDVLNRVFKSGEDAFIQFVETGKVNFGSLISSLISDLARLAFQSFVTKPLQNIFQGIIGNIVPGMGNIFGAPGAGTGYYPPTPSFNSVPAFATGGSWTVGGRGGVDSQLVQFRASPGERVSVDRNNGSTPRGQNNINFYITTPDVKGFKASESQIAARMQLAAAKGNRNR